jgi:putative transposase
MLKEEFPEYAGIDAQALQDVVERLDQSFQGFFKRGGGFPKYQGRNRYNSITFKQHSWKIEDGRLHIRNCGALKVKWSRPIEGRIKTITIKRTRSGEWYVCFSCDDVPAPQYAPTDKVIGIDLGIEALATTSEGERFENAKYLKSKQKYLRREQRHLERQEKGSNRRKKTVKNLQKTHQKIANQRRDANHKASTSLVRRYAKIIMEDISPQFMLKNHYLAQAASDVGWGQFTTFLQSKAAAAGREVIKVNPAYTSQMCSGCGQIKPKPLSQRWHECDCGLSLHRDHNAAINILNAAGL